MNAEPLFELRDLAFVYGGRNSQVLALSIPALAIGQGERVALLGPNGSGKTSLLKVLNGLASPASGLALFRGECIEGCAELRRRSVYLHQHPYLFAGSVSYNVSFGCRSRRLSRPEVAARVSARLALVGLSGFERRRHRALSGGEVQRVALARALATGADVFLLDEPTASADSASVVLVEAAIRAAAAEGATIVFSTHDATLAASLATRILHLDGGRICEDARNVN
jgi:energy-coupling factor transporter ATP-binding protein EcfA2